ncbi:hypothetical protein BJV77DRAFT_1058950 [Russula vinacea]|nr:hypothetical protein BJV77DRAFT_1058950 [Russula vinacea]
MTVEATVNIESLSASFPLTLPIPSPFTHPSLLSVKDLHREEDLLRNHPPQNALLKLEPQADIPPETRALLGPLASPTARQSLQRLTYLYEAALQTLLARTSSGILPSDAHLTKKKAGGKKRLPDMKDAVEEEQEDLEQWEGGLDGVVGWEEWRALVATFERALMWLPKLPRLWLMYLSIFSHQNCPPVLSHSHARRTFDRALRTTRGGLTTVAVYRRYLAIDPNPSPRPLEAAKLLLRLSRKAARGEYISSEGKSPYQLLGDLLDVVEAHAEQVGLGIEEVGSAEADEESAGEDAQQQQNGSGLIRFAGPPTAVSADGKPAPIYDEDEDPNSPRRLDVEKIIRKDGLAVYKDQAGRLWTGLAMYWIKRAEFERAKETFETGIATVLTIRDFTQIFDAYAEFSESVISGIMEELANPDEEDEDLDVKETEEELDAKMKEFEELMDRRRSYDVQEWEKRVAETYTRALSTIAPRRATPNLHRLYIDFAKFYEEGGTTGEAEADLASARKVLEKATKVNFKNVEDLAEIWCEWAEMEVRHENYDDAIRVMQRAAAVPKNTKALPVQARLFKSLKLWSFYVDLEESLGTVESTKTVYDKILELYFEESFKVYERGVELFTFPVSFEIWNIYLLNCQAIREARDLFEQALEKCPPKSCKPIFLMYSQLEEEYGLAKRAMSIYDRATQMFTIYIAKAAENYGLTATRPIYERALEVLPDRQTAKMSLRFAALERKLGEIDRARAIYAHASQFCDPRTNPEFWAEWHSFEIDTGSEDTFREMLRIKRSVQAQFNTESSYLAAQALAASQGAARDAEEEAVLDPMAAAEKQTSGKAALKFVSAKQQAPHQGNDEQAPSPQAVGNADEIQISDEEDI